MLVTLGLIAAAALGCGDRATPAGGKGDGGDRARKVAAAWEGSEAARAWQQGYYPLGAAVQLPDGAFHTDADKRAYITQNFELRAPLPETPKKKGKIRWRDGGSLALPLTSARAAYDQVARGKNPGPALTVSGVRLGDMTMLTSRGAAKVPAWLFTVKGYGTPLKRVAVTPAKLPRPPVGPVRQQTAELGPLAGLDTITEDGRTLTLRAEHGACDDGPAVHMLQRKGSVVFSASVRGVDDGLCTSELRTEKVTLRLDRPVGDRILLDAFTGKPVPYDQQNHSASQR
jgi:hypothetical protein